MSRESRGAEAPLLHLINDITSTTSPDVQTYRFMRVEVVFIGENRRVVYPGRADEYTITFTDALGLRWTQQDTQAAVRIIDSRAA
jgi:hypothetical protein